MSELLQFIIYFAKIAAKWTFATNDDRKWKSASTREIKLLE